MLGASKSRSTPRVPKRPQSRSSGIRKGLSIGGDSLCRVGSNNTGRIQDATSTSPLTLSSLSTSPSRALKLNRPRQHQRTSSVAQERQTDRGLQQQRQQKSTFVTPSPSKVSRSSSSPNRRRHVTGNSRDLPAVRKGLKLIGYDPKNIDDDDSHNSHDSHSTDLSFNGRKDNPSKKEQDDEQDEKKDEDDQYHPRAKFRRSVLQRRNQGRRRRITNTPRTKRQNKSSASIIKKRGSKMMSKNFAIKNKKMTKMNRIHGNVEDVKKCHRLNIEPRNSSSSSSADKSDNDDHDDDDYYNSNDEDIVNSSVMSSTSTMATNDTELSEVDDDNLSLEDHQQYAAVAGRNKTQQMMLDRTQEMMFHRFGCTRPPTKVSDKDPDLAKVFQKEEEKRKRDPKPRKAAVVKKKMKAHASNVPTLASVVSFYARQSETDKNNDLSKADEDTPAEERNVATSASTASAHLGGYTDAKVYLRADTKAHDNGDAADEVYPDADPIEDPMDDPIIDEAAERAQGATAASVPQATTTTTTATTITTTTNASVPLDADTTTLPQAAAAATSPQADATTNTHLVYGKGDLVWVNMGTKELQLAKLLENYYGHFEEVKVAFDSRPGKIHSIMVKDIQPLLGRASCRKCQDSKDTPTETNTMLPSKGKIQSTSSSKGNGKKGCSAPSHARFQADNDEPELVSESMQPEDIQDAAEVNDTIELVNENKQIKFFHAPTDPEERQVLEDFARAINQRYEEWFSDKGGVVDIGTYFSNEEKSNDHKFFKFKLASKRVADKLNTVWEATGHKSRFFSKKMEVRDGQKNFTFLNDMKVLGNGEHAKPIVVPRDEDGLGNVEIIRERIIADMKENGLCYERLHWFNQKNRFFSSLGLPEWKVDIDHGNKYVQLYQLDEYTFLLGGYEIHIGNPTRTLPYEFFPPHCDKIGDIVCFLALAGSSYNIVVVEDRRGVEMTKWSEAYNALEDGRYYTGDMAGDDQAEAFKNWCNDMKSTRYKTKFGQGLRWFFKRLMEERKSKRVPVRVLVYKVEEFDKLLLPAGTFCHGTVLPFPTFNMETEEWEADPEPRNLVIFHQLDLHD